MLLRCGAFVQAAEYDDDESFATRFATPTPPQVTVVRTRGRSGPFDKRALQPPVYWRELFERRGFVRRDVLRAKIIHDREIPAWYRQNLFLYVAAIGRKLDRFRTKFGSARPPDLSRG